jgi:hypothetical protein
MIVRAIIRATPKSAATRFDWVCGQSVNAWAVGAGGRDLPREKCLRIWGGRPGFTGMTVSAALPLMMDCANSMLDPGVANPSLASTCIVT